MIPILGTQFTVLNPLALALFPVAGAFLVYAYRRKGRSHIVQVPTLLLLASFKSAARARKRFLPPFRFFLELFLFLLLLFGAAELFRIGPKKRVAVLLDNSLSMALSP